jgi:hypothetical protein
VFLTVASNRAVTQAATGAASTPLFVFAVLGASEDVTVTEFDWVLLNVDVLLSDEWPDALATSVNPVRFSPTGAVKVHVAVELGAIPVLPPGGQLTLVAVPS